eukprot:366124-Chlamydomonas_euryale.AAC.17
MYVGSTRHTGVPLRQARSAAWCWPEAVRWTGRRACVRLGRSFRLPPARRAPNPSPSAPPSFRAVSNPRPARAPYWPRTDVSRRRNAGPGQPNCGRNGVAGQRTRGPPETASDRTLRGGVRGCSNSEASMHAGEGRAGRAAAATARRVTASCLESVANLSRARRVGEEEGRTRRAWRVALEAAWLARGGVGGAAVRTSWVPLLGWAQATCDNFGGGRCTARRAVRRHSPPNAARERSPPHPFPARAHPTLRLRPPSSLASPLSAVATATIQSRPCPAARTMRLMTERPPIRPLQHSVEERPPVRPVQQYCTAFLSIPWSSSVEQATRGASTCLGCEGSSRRQNEAADECVRLNKAGITSAKGQALSPNCSWLPFISTSACMQAVAMAMTMALRNRESVWLKASQ